MIINGNVNVNGNIIERNSGSINQNFNATSNVDSSLSDLLNKLAQDDLTREQSKLLAESLDKYENSSEEEKKSLSSKITSIADTLVNISKASTAIYPIAAKVFELIKSIVQ